MNMVKLSITRRPGAFWKKLHARAGSLLLGLNALVFLTLSCNPPVTTKTNPQGGGTTPGANTPAGQSAHFSPRQLHSSVVLNGSLYVIGGRESNLPFPGTQCRGNERISDRRARMGPLRFGN